MNVFSYQAFDRSGQQHSGTLEAANANDLVRRLSTQGLIVQSVNPVAAQPIAPVAPVVAAPVVQPAPVIAKPRIAYDPILEQPVSKRVNVLPPLEPILTGFFKDHDLFLLMAQFANLLRSGVSPAEACHHLAGRISLKPKVKKALEQMAKTTSQGYSLADAMGQFPEIFPPGTVGAVRAGSEGGYMWQSCQYVADQTQSSWRLRRVGSWVALAFWSTIILVPFIPIFRYGSQQLMRMFNEPDIVPVNAWLTGIGTALMGPWGIVALLMLVTCFWGSYVTGRLKFLPLRHQLAAKLPLIARRTKLENMDAFAFHIEHLSIAGISPYAAYKSAASAVPNVIVAEELRRAGASMHEASKLSVALHQTGVMPPEYVNLVETGELTGQVAGALNQVQVMADAERKNWEMFLKIKAWVWIGLLTFGFSTIFFALMYRGFLDEAWKAIFQGVE